MNQQSNPTALFVADSHFHQTPTGSEFHRIEKFIEFLSMAHQVDHLFLVGDIFDFWFDYPHFRLKGYDSILHALDQVKQSGTTIHFIGGNHDIWASDYFHERYGCNPTGAPVTLQLGNLRVQACHGDGLLGYDWAYNTFRTIVRTKPGIVLAKSLHPEVLFSLSTWLSGQSRSADRDEATQIEAKGDKWIARQGGADWDLMVMGHVHHPFITSHGDHKLAALAGWFDAMGYGLLKDGKFQLLDFVTDPLPEL
jgi:UDP-2,3-diacylglucosamine hydrolase